VRFGSLAVLAFAILLVGCGGAAGRKAAYLAKGQEFMAAHNYTKARLEFRNALQLDPNDAQANYLAGQATEQVGNIREAVQLFQAAIQTDPKHLGARAQLGLLYAYGGAPDKAIEVVEPGLAIAPNDPDLLIARAAARMRLGDMASAQADAEKAVQAAPTNENAVALLAALYQQAGNSQQAIDLVNKALQPSTPGVKLRQVLAQLYLATNRHPEAIQEMQRVIAAEPDQLVYRYRLAEVQLLDKNVDAAEATLRAAVAQAPKNSQAKLTLANMLAANRSYDVADAELRRMIAASPDDYQLRLGLGQFYLSHNKLPEAEAVYRQVIKDDGTGPNGLTARDRLAGVYLNSNQPDTAAQLLDEVLKKNPRDNDALYDRAELSLAHGKPDAAVADLRTVQRDQPNSVAIQRALARAYLQNEDNTLAEETLRAAVQGNPSNIDLQLDLARLLAATGRRDEAVAQLQKLAAAQPTNLGVLQALFDVQMAGKDFAGARHTAELVQSAKPTAPSGIYMSGLAELGDGKPNVARTDFERAAAMSPDAIEPFGELVRLDLQQQHPDQALARLDKAIGQYPNNPMLPDMKGQALASLNRNDEAIASFRQAIRLQPTWTEPYRRLAAAQLAAGHGDDAIKSLQEGIQASNQAPQLQVDLAALDQRLGHTDDAIAQYEALLKRDAQSAVAANNLAMLLVTYRTDQASLDRARTLTERLATSRNGAFLDTRGWVLYKRGEYADALNALQKATTQAPQAPEFRYHLAMVQLISGTPDAARASLEQALKSNVAFADSDEAKKTLASLQR
jgi:tetratricopeptide (TPR) repeat protein